MKLHCHTCGIHFQDEFEETLREDCGFWKERGFPESFPLERKRQLWDWWFGFPIDEVAEETGWMVEMGVKVSPWGGNFFKNNVAGYKDWPDKKRKEFQRDWFRFVHLLSHEEQTRIVMRQFVLDRGETLVTNVAKSGEED